MKGVKGGVQSAEQDVGGQSASPEEPAECFFAVFDHARPARRKVYFQDPIGNSSHGKLLLASQSSPSFPPLRKGRNFPFLGKRGQGRFLLGANRLISPILSFSLSPGGKI
jgi:hypothetical protein